MEISTARRNRKKENKTIIYLKENSIFAISFQSKRLYNINIIHMKLSKLCSFRLPACLWAVAI